jgi:phage terminase large subunit-like protein
MDAAQLAERPVAAEQLSPRPAWLAAFDGRPEYEWARIGWTKAAAVPGAWYDQALADEVIRQWPELFKLTQDRFAGLPYRLADYQMVIVRLLVGWRAPEEHIDPATGSRKTYHLRIFRRLDLWVPRKNGKTEFLGALGLLFFIVDGVVDGEGYCFARDENQARIVLKRMKAMIAYNPDWNAGVLTYNRSFYVKALRAGFQMLTGSEEGKHGGSPTVVVGDEMHEWRSRVVAETLEEGTGARLEWIFLYGSTTGTKTNRTGVECWDESLAILEGRIEAPHVLVCIFAAAPDDDIWDEAVWAKANPNLGVTPTLPFMRAEAAKARTNPRAEARFRCYHLNQWIEAHVRWLNMKAWDACAGSRNGWKLYPDTLEGRTAFAAFDISSTTDITARALVFPPEAEDPKWRLALRFWAPEETWAERCRADRRFEAWQADGAIETTRGNYVDQSFVERDLVDCKRRYRLIKTAFDPWNAAKLVTDLQKPENGFEADELVEMRQGILSFAEPSKQFERLVYAGLLDHGGHPVLRWMAANVVVRFDENLNFMPAKKRSAEKIDGVVASVMGVGIALAGEGDEESVYEALARRRAAETSRGGNA